MSRGNTSYFAKRGQHAIMQVSHKRPGELVRWSDDFGVKHCCSVEDKGVLSGRACSDISTLLGVRRETLVVQ